MFCFLFFVFGFCVLRFSYVFSCCLVSSGLVVSVAIKKAFQKEDFIKELNIWRTFALSSIPCNGKIFKGRLYADVCLFNVELSMFKGSIKN